MTLVALLKRDNEKTSLEASNVYEDIWVARNGLDITCFTNIYLRVPPGSTTSLASFMALIFGKVSATKDVSDFFLHLAANPQNSVAVHQYEDGITLNKEKSNLFHMTINNIICTKSKHSVKMTTDITNSRITRRNYSIVTLNLQPPVKKGETRAIKIFYHTPSRAEQTTKENFKLLLYPYDRQWMSSFESLEGLRSHEVVAAQRYGAQLILPNNFELVTSRTSKIVWQERNECDTCEYYCPYPDKVHENVPPLGRKPSNFFKFSRERTTNLFPWTGPIMHIEYVKSSAQRREKKHKKELGLLEWLKGPK